MSSIFFEQSNFEQMIMTQFKDTYLFEIFQTVKNTSQSLRYFKKLKIFQKKFKIFQNKFKIFQKKLKIFQTVENISEKVEWIPRTCQSHPTS